MHSRKLISAYWKFKDCLHNFLHEERRWIISSIWPELYHTDFFDLGQYTIRPSQAASSKIKAQTKF
jgi:hypothetical protein